MSLATQSEDIDVISAVNLIENTQRSFSKLLEIYTIHPKISEKLPTLKKPLEQIDNKNFYQGTKVRGIAQEKEYLENNVVVVICKIVTCFEERYGTLFCDTDNPSAENIRRETIEGDSMLYSICKILNTKYHAMPIFASCNVADIKNGFLSLVKYAVTYFSVHQMVPLTLWKNIFEISNDLGKYQWKKTLLLIEIASCVPQSNAVLESFFS